MRYSEMLAREKLREWQAARAAAHLAPPARHPWLWPGLILLGTVLVLASCATPQYRDPDAPMTTNGPVDLERYMGLWYEVARLPNRFEEGCVGVTAEYILNEDGTVRVLNTCRQGTLDGPVETAEGTATSVSPENDRLRVSFVSWLPFAAGDYWILDVDDAYQVAVVGSPSGSVGWVLARTPRLSPQRLGAAFKVLERNGYNLDRIIAVQQ